MAKQLASVNVWNGCTWETIYLGDRVMVYHSHIHSVDGQLMSGYVVEMEDLGSKRGVWVTVLNRRSGAEARVKSTCIQSLMRYKHGHMPIMPEDRQFMDEIREDPYDYQRLKDKARWEACTPHKVLREWGDPRDWSLPREKQLRNHRR